MKIQILVLLISLTATIQIFSQENTSPPGFTNVYHYGNNISIKNYDGMRSTIYVSGNSATLYNPDGTQSSIDFNKKSSTIVKADGTIATVFHNKRSSTVFNADGSSILISHSQSTSTCTNALGKHSIRHTFADREEIKIKNQIDVLIHLNWLVKKIAEHTTVIYNSEEDQN